MIENPLIDIFTEKDDSLFSDGALDPMGIRIIWTSLGENIFNNKLNTVSNNVRLFTQNLFHHHIVREFCMDQQSVIQKLVGQGPYRHTGDIHDGLIIFLECLQTHMISGLFESSGSDDHFVPGMNKFSGLKRTNPQDPLITGLIAERGRGILIRQVGLGIHGRHHGPFMEMDLFKSYERYADHGLWDGIGAIFQRIAEWKDLGKHINRQLINLVNRECTRDGLYMDSSSVLADVDLKNAYASCSNRTLYQHPLLISFWEQRLGLQSGAAGAMYNAVKMTDTITWREVIISAREKKPEEIEKIEAIIAVEPFLSCIHKCMMRLLQRGTMGLNADLISFIVSWLKKKLTDPILLFCNSDYFTPNALKRLTKLIDIYQVCSRTMDAVGFIAELILYHRNTLQERGRMPWLAYDGVNITQYRSVQYDQNGLAWLADDCWVNSYYLPSLKNIYNGFYGNEILQEIY